MNITPSESEFVRLAAQGNLIPVYADLVADFATPVAIYARLRRGGVAFLFESVEGGEHIGRYSFAGCRPHETIAAYEKRALNFFANPIDPRTFLLFYSTVFYAHQTH